MKIPVRAVFRLFGYPHLGEPPSNLYQINFLLNLIYQLIQVYLNPLAKH